MIHKLTARQLFEFLFVLALFTMAVRETLDSDMWWHLRTGELILQDGIPRQDTFSFTVPDNQWITHEWLSEVFMWLVYQVGSFPGLILVFAAIITLAFWLVYLRCNGRPYLATFVVLLAALASAPLWGVRPQMFNILFAALFVFLVEGFKDGKVSRRTLWLLPFLTLIWANLHSGYLLGVALLATYVIGESGQLLFHARPNRGLDWPAVGWLTLMTLLSFLAAVLNPNGPELWIYPFFTLGSHAMQQYIQEWQSPDFHLSFFWPFAAMLLLGMISLLASRRKPALTDVLLYTGTGAAGLLSARHIPIFSIVATPVITRYLYLALDGTRSYAFLSGRSEGKSNRGMTALNWVLLIVLALVAVIWIVSKVQGNSDEIADHYPVAAVDYLKNSGLAEQRGFNTYNWGGYLIWRDIPVFVDGRADVYGDEFLHYYRRTFDLTSRWRQPLDEYEVDYIIIEQSSPLSNLLMTSGQWLETYTDDVAVVFTRAGE
jgi:hypothetical protein